MCSEFILNKPAAPDRNAFQPTNPIVGEIAFVSPLFRAIDTTTLPMFHVEHPS